MAAWTPILQDVSHYSLDLKGYLDKSYNDLISQRLTRSVTADWKTKVEKEILKDQRKVHGFECIDWFHANMICRLKLCTTGWVHL